MALSPRPCSAVTVDAGVSIPSMWKTVGLAATRWRTGTPGRRARGRRPRRGCWRRSLLAGRARSGRWLPTSWLCLFPLISLLAITILLAAEMNSQRRISRPAGGGIPGPMGPRAPWPGAGRPGPEGPGPGPKVPGTPVPAAGLPTGWFADRAGRDARCGRGIGDGGRLGDRALARPQAGVRGPQSPGRGAAPGPLEFGERRPVQPGGQRGYRAPQGRLRVRGEPLAGQPGRAWLPR